MARNQPKNEATPEMIEQENDARVGGSGLGNAISRMRQLQVALEARAKKDKDLVEFLKQKLENNLKAQLTDNLTIRRQSVREMQILRDEIWRGNLKLSQKQRDEFYGAYNRAIQESVKTNSILAQTASDFAASIKGNLPSLDNVLSAVSVANPVVGFGLKLTKDMIVSISRRNKAFEEERKKTLHNLEVEARKLAVEEEAAQQEVENQESIREAVEKEDANADAEKTDRKRKSEKYDPEDTQKAWLKRIYGLMEDVRLNTELMIDNVASESSLIRSETPRELERMRPRDMSSSLSNEAFEKLVSAQSVLHDDLEKVKDDTSELVRINQAELQAQQQERMKNIEESRENNATTSTIASIAPEKKHNNLGEILGMIGMARVGLIGGAIGALSTAAMAFIKPIVGLFTGLLKLAKFIPGAGLIVGAVEAGISFFTGFTDAANILNKPENQIDFGDKVAAGIGSIVGALGGLIDWLGSMLGFDTNLKELLTTKVAEFFAKSFDNIETYIKSAFEMVDGWFGNIGNIIDNVATWAKENTGIGFLTDLFGGDKSESSAQSSSAKIDPVAAVQKKLAQSERMDDLTEEAKRGALTPTASIVAPSKNVINNSTTQALSIPRSSRNDDRTLARIHQMSTQGAR